MEEIYLLYKENNELKLATSKVRYMQHGEEIIQSITTEGTQWWNDFSEKWNHTEILEFIDIKYTEEQILRFSEIKDIELNETILEEYVMEGILGEGLQMLFITKENEKLKNLLADLTELTLPKVFGV